MFRCYENPFRIVAYKALMLSNAAEFSKEKSMRTEMVEYRPMGVLLVLVAMLVLFMAPRLLSQSSPPCGNVVVSTDVRYDDWELCADKPELGGCYEPEGDYSGCGYKVKSQEWTCGPDRSQHGGQACYPDGTTSVGVTDMWNDCVVDENTGRCRCDNVEPPLHSAVQLDITLPKLKTDGSSLCPTW